MRVGYLTYGLDRSPTGIGRYSVELLKAMAEAPGGAELVVLATEREDPYALGEMFEYHRVPGCRMLPALMSVGSALLPYLARRHNLDVIHDPNGIAPFLGAFKQSRLMVTIHDAVTYVYPESHNAGDNWRYRWHLPYSTRSADAVITVSESSRRDISKYFGVDDKKLFVVPEGINRKFRVTVDASMRRRLNERYGIRDPFVLYLGALNARKNVTALLEAFSEVRTKYPGLKLVIGGKRQWQAGEIDDRLERLELEESVVFTGYIDDEDLPAIYSAATVFAFPSLYEGFGLPPLEAMACGTPVITSNVSSLPEVTGDAAVLINPFDIAELASALDRVLGSESLQRDMCARGLRRAAEFTWERAARQTIEVYQRVTGHSGDYELSEGAGAETERTIAV